MKYAVWLWAQQISDGERPTVFQPLWTLILSLSAAHLWHSVNIFPENFNTNVLPCFLQTMPKRLSFEWIIVVPSLFSSSVPADSFCSSTAVRDYLLFDWPSVLIIWLLFIHACVHTYALVCIYLIFFNVSFHDCTTISTSATATL